MKIRSSITKLYCPFCGEEMDADIHTGPKNEFKRGECWYDNWICNSGDNNDLTCKVTKQLVLFDRDDIEKWLN
jgi:hypothetical protein